MNVNLVSPTRKRASGVQFIISTFTVLTLVFAGLGQFSSTPAMADEETAAIESPTEEVGPDTSTALEEPTETEVPEPTPIEEVFVAPEESVVEEPASEPEAEPTAPEETVEPEPTATTAPIEPTAEATEEPTDDPLTETPENIEEAADASSDNSEPTATPTPEPTPYLTYTASAHPRCRPVDDQREVVASGDSLDYDCTYDIELAGDHLSPNAILLDWTVLATFADGWSVQFLPPTADPDREPEWTDETHDLGGFQHESPVAGSTLDSSTDSFTTTQQLSFGLRLHRATCATNPPTLELNVSAWASLPGLDTAVIEDTADESVVEPYKLAPGLAPVPDPSLAFAGSLDFGNVPVDANGVREEPAPQTITVTVSGLDQACGNWALGLKAKNIGGEDGSSLPAASLNLVSVNDDTRPDGGCPLNQGCEVAVVEAGPGAPPTITLTLGVSLVLPDQLSATTFNSTLTASLSEASP